MTKWDKYKDHIYYYYPFLKGICTVLEVKGRDMHKCKRTLCADDTRQIFLEYMSGDALCAIQKDYFVRSLCPDCMKELLLWLDTSTKENENERMDKRS